MYSARYVIAAFFVCYSGAVIDAMEINARNVRRLLEETALANSQAIAAGGAHCEEVARPEDFEKEVHKQENWTHFIDAAGTIGFAALSAITGYSAYLSATTFYEYSTHPAISIERGSVTVTWDRHTDLGHLNLGAAALFGASFAASMYEAVMFGKRFFSKKRTEEAVTKVTQKKCPECLLTMYRQNIAVNALYMAYAAILKNKCGGLCNHHLTEYNAHLFAHD